MAVLLPLRPLEPSYTMNVTLRGEEVRIDVRWNERDTGGAWYTDWFDADGDPIVRGLKIVLGVNLGRTVLHRVFRRIVVRAVDTSGKGIEPGFDDLGTRVVVRVYTVTDTGFVE